MLEFTYYTPTKVVFGPDTEQQTGALLQEMGAHKVLIHYGSERVKINGLIPMIEKSLDELGIGYVELGGVVPNPHLDLVYKGIDLCREEGVDFLLAVGGGSVIDSAKAIGYGLADPEKGDVWDFYEKIRKPTGCAPVGVVLTLAATGSEMSNSSVITKVVPTGRKGKDGREELGGIKRGCNSDVVRPRFAVLDPKLTLSLPEYQTMCGATDICMHTLERYLNNAGYMEITDEIAEGLLRTVMHNAHVLLNNPENYEARAELMWAGSLSHNGLTGCGSDGGDWACHRLEHELSGMFDCAHGAGLAAIWGSWARYVCRNNPMRFARLGSALFHDGRDLLHLTGPELEQAALDAIGHMEDFFRSIHMPTSLRELGIEPTDEEYRALAHNCLVATGGVGSMKRLDEQDMEAIYRAAL